MTMRPAIQGIGVVGGFGAGVSALRAALRSGAVATSTLAVRDHGIPAYLADLSPLDEFVPRRNLRRVDRFSQMALLGASLALQDADRSVADCRRLGLIVASGYGPMRTTFAFLDSYLDVGASCSSPTHFSNSVHNAAAANIAILMGIDGPNLTVSQFEMSIHVAMMTACQWLQQDLVDSVLIGGVDECDEVLGYCWERFLGVIEGPLQPLAFDRQTAIPGEGSGFILLDKKDTGKYGLFNGAQFHPPGKSLVGLPMHLVLGADGHKECGTSYLKQLDPSFRVAGYANLYGSMPVAPVFDLACAALVDMEARHFQCQDSGRNVFYSLSDVITYNKEIKCVKFSRNGNCGVVSFEKNY